MKIVIALAAFVALGSGHALPSVPGDNSHYVEGESRYIWMPDSEDTPVLVDLHEPVDKALVHARNGANNQYWLYTRSNQNSKQILVNGNINSVRNSNYASNKGIKVIVHGWNNNGDSHVNTVIRQAFLAVQDVNVIVVDWRGLAGSSYTSAAAGVPGIGQHLGNFLVWLINNAGGNWNNVHLVGHSLGAHVVGSAGRQAGGRPSRVTGLDPAGPGWGNNGNALNRNSGRYVEAIHTDGNILGLMNAIADADFYPNGGKHPQPGCALSTCSHGRANDLFASTIRHNRFTAKKCNNVWEAELSTCSGSNLNMGNAQINKSGSGIFALRTGSSWPF
ncbi:pancreatic triacylglycerol lipase-like [Trichoplusia ni]|uniref:Pancreatic triacylglycerol lipase-like n=1 Tax=Trichoplusia ni TaxID=7111 RepID=A0A7E5VUH3_TRINI|nr:pancreatic triacylglycerol lipase-like [Trichoplusia ni]